MLRKKAKKLRIQTKRKLRKLTELFDQEPKQIGLPPGTLVYTGEKEKEPVTILLLEYDQNSFIEKQIDNIDDILISKENEKVSWINVEGVHDIQLMEKIQSYFNIHPLAMEDIVHTTQRPKAEEYSDQLFIVTRMFIYDEENQDIKNEQVSFILGKNYLLTFLEDPGDVFNPVRERIRKDGTKIRSNGADFLAYALIDAIVDSYFHILEKLGEDIEELEDRLVVQPTREDLQSVHQMRRNMILLRKSVWPLREVISHLQRNEHEIINQSTQIYLRDVYDHIIQIMDTIESYRDMIVGMLDVYLSSTSNKLNEIMKVLTIISTLFIPLTFLAGVYGMNFHYFPELEIKWMYPWGFWIVSLSISFGMIIFFKRKKWF
ncbi:MAG: magnesium/cobalt transporter CorA [Ignavibacterium album]|jgi:magnesium transporter|uniref:Magnesium transport protein CorA n=1 Tax=Ignavibacterium album TaxID=591197 RepID=A0A7V3E643_9BACT|nr:magnesium/cobalt transporter CorA [Ignavibacterium album]MCX8105768.1 magnesium/cobalt transporter CorA [Ignavibacterium album]